MSEKVNIIGLNVCFYTGHLNALFGFLKINEMHQKSKYRPKNAALFCQARFGPRRETDVVLADSVWSH